MRINNFIFFTLVISIFTGCVEVNNQFSSIPPGIWRATLDLTEGGSLDIISTDNETDRVFTELSDGELPFNFEVIYSDDTTFYIEIINAEERIRVDDVFFGKDKYTNQDTILIDFPVFDAYITALYEEDKIQGFYHVNYRDNYKIPFNAVFGQGHRFTNLTKEPKANLSGKWETTFEIDTEYEYKGIGEFQQSGNHLKGTFLTETGDYRFLEGTVQGDKAYLSCFDGAHAFLFVAKILDDGSLIGSFRSGNHYVTTWEAVKNEDFELSDPDNLTFVKGQEQFNFSLENLDGEKISPFDDQYKDKVTLITIFGTWCPNCRDEMNFLLDYLEKNPDVDFEIIGVAFERYKEKEKGLQAMKRFQEKMNVPFELVYGGYYDKEEALNQFPMLNKIISYPTLIILDKDKNVRKIHTGFSGPATSEYEEFKSKFDNVIKDIVNEQ